MRCNGFGVLCFKQVPINLELFKVMDGGEVFFPVFNKSFAGLTYARFRDLGNLGFWASKASNPKILIQGSKVPFIIRVQCTSKA